MIINLVLIYFDLEFFGEIAAAVSARTLVAGESTKDLEFAFVWHMPFVDFRNQTKTYERSVTLRPIESVMVQCCVILQRRINDLSLRGTIKKFYMDGKSGAEQ